MTVRARAIGQITSAAATAMLLVASCRQLADIGQKPACEGLESPRASCTTCQRAECCDVALACRADPACRALDTCLAGCANDECRTECGKNHVGALTGAYATLASCHARSCSAACKAPCGGYVFRDAACATCSGSACCSQAAACASSPECLALAYCERQCKSGDAACRGGCQRAHPAGLSLAQSLSACLAESCASDCKMDAPEPDWTCRGDPKPPQNPGNPLELEVTVEKANGFGKEPDPAIAAKVTAKPGNALVAEGTTGLDGKVLLTGDLKTGYNDALDIEEGGLRKLRAYVDPPLVGSTSLAILGFSPESFQGTFWPLGADASLGHIALRAFDCAGNDAAGVSFSLECLSNCPATKAIPYYGYYAEGKGTATVPGDGTGGFLNVSPSNGYQVVVTARNTGVVLAKRSVHVSAGVTTTVSLYPTGYQPQLSATLGQRCASNAECGATLICLKATSTDWSGQGPARGYCTADCSQNKNVCNEVAPNATCLTLPNGAAFCVERCNFGPKDAGTFNPKKCHGRPEVACAPLFDEKDVFIEAACLPQCNADPDCGGALHCNPRTGLCSTEPATGKGIGEACEKDPDGGTDECRGTCSRIVDGPTHEFVTNVCTEGCTAGVLLSCGWGGPGTGPASAACIFHRTVVFENAGMGPGDLGSCGQLCDCNDDCKDPALVCAPWSENAAANEKNFGRKGYCGAPKGLDGGVIPGLTTCPDAGTSGGS